MEWSRHDKVVITIVSYIIGFTTAFIAFGMNDLQQKVVQDTPVFTFTQNANTQKTDENNSVLIVIEEDGLRVITEDAQRLLSARRGTALTANLVESTPGYAYRFVDAELSRDNNYAYYCEQIDEQSSTCDPYVYVIEEDLLVPVTLDGQVYKPTMSTHASSWSPENILTISGNSSKDAEYPWMLSSE